jgi:hypothetical protein
LCSRDWSHLSSFAVILRLSLLPPSSLPPTSLPATPASSCCSHRQHHSTQQQQQLSRSVADQTTAVATPRDLLFSLYTVRSIHPPSRAPTGDRRLGLSRKRSG